MAKYPSKYPNGLYEFNHKLMLISLTLLLLVIAICFIILPFGKIISFEFLEWWCEFIGWAFPILFVLFLISSGVFVNGFVEHRCKKEYEDKDNYTRR